MSVALKIEQYKLVYLGNIINDSSVSYGHANNELYLNWTGLQINPSPDIQYINCTLQEINDIFPNGLPAVGDKLTLSDITLPSTSYGKRINSLVAEYDQTDNYNTITPGLGKPYAFILTHDKEMVFDNDGTFTMSTSDNGIDIDLLAGVRAASEGFQFTFIGTSNHDFSSHEALPNLIDVSSIQTLSYVPPDETSAFGTDQNASTVYDFDLGNGNTIGGSAYGRPKAIIAQTSTLAGKFLYLRYFKLDGSVTGKSIKFDGDDLIDDNQEVVATSGNGVASYQGFSLRAVIVDKQEIVPVAPTPTHSQGEVLSFFSSTYTDISGTNFIPNWGQNTVVTVDTNLTYVNLNYQGTQFSAIDVTIHDTLHVDFYTSDTTFLQFFLISPGGNENLVNLTNDIVQGQWVSKDIDLKEYSGDWNGSVDLTSLFQFKVVGDGTVHFNNLYFHGNALEVAGEVELIDTSSALYIEKSIKLHGNLDPSSEIKVNVNKVNDNTVTVTAE